MFYLFKIGVNNTKIAMFMFFDDYIRSRKIYKQRRYGDENNFKSLYRFTRPNVNWLADHFLEENHETRGGAITNSQKMQTFLRYVGDPGFQVGVGEDLGIHQTTVCKLVWKVCQEIVAKAGEWIVFPTTETEMEDAKLVWARKYSFPSAIGALDCTHVQIVKPSIHGDEYIGRKGFPSLNVQATCDANELFTSIDCNWPGSVHDSRIWRNSKVHEIITDNRSGALLLGDEGYGIMPWVMTPYRDTQTVQELNYNKIHTQERVIIERVFGQVKRRFPLLQSKVRIQTERVPAMIVACFVLHNIAKHLQDTDFCGPDIIHRGEIEVPSLDNVNDTNKKRGENRRNQIASYLLRV